MLAPSRKRTAPDDDDIAEIELPVAKRSRTNGAPSTALPESPSKKRKLEEDGWVLLNSVNDKIDKDDDVIEID